NDGLFDVAFDATISSGEMQFINNGILQKSAGSGTFNLDCTLAQNGTLTTQHCEMVILDNVLLAAGSTTDFDTAIVLFDDPATLDSLATITGGDRYRFDGTTITIDALLPQDKYLSLETGTVLFNRDFTFTDTLDQISSIVGGSGSVTVEGVYLWKDDPITTTVHVSPPGQMWLMTNQTKSLSSDGRLSIAGEVHHLDGTLSFTSNDTLHIASGGTYYYNGGEISGGLGEVMVNDGVFEVSFPGLLTSSSLQFINNGTFRNAHTGLTDVNAVFINDSTIAGRGAIDFLNLVNSGEVEPGLSVDTLTFLPEFDNTNNTLSIEIESTSGPGTGNDLLRVTGPATLAGTLNVHLINGFAPVAGHCYTILESTAGVTGAFTSINLPGSAPEWTVIYYPDSVVVQHFMFNCPAPDTVSTDPGFCSFTQPDATRDMVALQNCGDATIMNDSTGTATLTGVVFELGENIITWTVDDGHGNVATCTSVIVVEDNEPPTPVCHDVTVQLDATGNGGITAAQVDNGSADACGIASTALDITAFDCGDVGPNAVVMTVADNNGNIDTCHAMVTVEDLVEPAAVCQDVTVQLDATGNGGITAAQVDNGSADACGIASTALD
ncbi:MAG: hypothetical protein R3330_09700, partial [Saprospiraceae bacterium]|nr:hypothetical protein [Saprospiraceae bacterium]